MLLHERLKDPEDPFTDELCMSTDMLNVQSQCCMWG